MSQSTMTMGEAYRPNPQTIIFTCLAQIQTSFGKGATSMLHQMLQSETDQNKAFLLSLLHDLLMFYQQNEELQQEIEQAEDFAHLLEMNPTYLERFPD